MPESDLKSVKQQVSDQFLGRDGIHSVGMSRARDAVCLYIDDKSAASEKLLTEIESLAAPHRVEVVESPSAKLTRKLSAG